ncbi:TcaA 3rd/4th domain-containing protein [Planococcus shenhongbingii]|uniref:Zinc ribbon domain-containing protein n=1 Tax=Planococcus shenhongbingii TaxID=3058398 RepID=A0ABT8N9S4_9BACL|nr:hypothetical protein [Planococcus sp. N017]MDN7244648.1 hypothetical protein [Planococcus sp. N017]
MKNCTNCGTASKGSDKFCLNCGLKFEDEVSPAPSQDIKRTPLPPKQRKKRMVGLTVAAMILLGLIGTHLYLQSKYDATKSIIEMNQAYSKNDAAKLLSYFSLADDVVKDEKEFYLFIEQEGWEDVRDQLKTETKLLKAEGLSNIILDSNGNKFISVVTEPVFLGLYDRVSFLVHPITVKAELPLNKTTVEIDSQKVTGNSGETVTVGKFLPGSYTWTASAKSSYSPIKNKGTASIEGDGTNIYVFRPELDAGKLKITSDVEDAVLFIDGKSTGKTVKEMNSIEPIAFDGSVEIAAETKNDKGKTIKSKPISVESASAHLTFAHVQEKAAAERAEKQAAEELENLVETNEFAVSEYIISFRDSFEMALNHEDFSFISDFFPPGSQVQADYVADINRHTAMDEYYYYDFESTVITGVQAVDKNILQVTTDEIFLFSSYEDDYQYYKTKKYTIEVQDYGFYILDIEQLTTQQTAI